MVAAVSSRVIAAAFLVVLGFLVFGRSSCDNTDALKELLLDFDTVMKEHQIDYRLDAGLFLGAIREHRILPWEFDNDIAVRIEDRGRVIALRDEFKRRFGYTLYTSDEAIFAKGFYELYFFRWSPYIVGPCARVYNRWHWFHVDVFCDYEVQPADVPADCERSGCTPPSAQELAAATEPYICQNGDVPCRPKSRSYPWVPFEMYGRQFLVLHDPEWCLAEEYGKNWRVPLPKGIKSGLCTSLFWPAVLATYLALGLFLYKRGHT
eukprot:m.100436 g.100436  ORF g.100436 m.100436 type:complete len:264 (+) comp15399_c0_seq1:912-1703(+)